MVPLLMLGEIWASQGGCWHGGIGDTRSRGDMRLLGLSCIYSLGGGCWSSDVFFADLWAFSSRILAVRLGIVVSGAALGSGVSRDAQSSATMMTCMQVRPSRFFFFFSFLYFLQLSSFLFLVICFHLGSFIASYCGRGSRCTINLTA